MVLVLDVSSLDAVQVVTNPRRKRYGKSILLRHMELLAKTNVWVDREKILFPWPSLERLFLGLANFLDCNKPSIDSSCVK